MRGLGIAGSGRAARPFLSRLQAAGIGAASFAVPGSGAGPLDRDGFARGLTTLILVPADIAEAEALLFEAQGFAKRVPSLKTVVIAATLSPRYVRALRGRIAASIALVDAPYSGTMRAAEEGRLSFFLGGGKDEIASLAPIFGQLGHKAARMGGFGTAMAAKVMNDFLAASTTAMTRIALDWAEAQGIEDAQLLDMTECLFSGRALPGCDMVDYGAGCLASDDCIATLVKEVESALDTALAGAHLTPPRALDDVFRSMKARPLH
ncbi:NAD(P)-binding domain-containing protein [Defluviimonas sp. SAOS-178_SWC]|uniref:NAD(P)-binding domain-containing protein n=1 Tax=Defluviimonas sp. SAOS-178_SWC TaxID=3121287 RepID=UPI0032213AFC